MINKGLPILIMVIISSCTSNSDYIIQNQWKYEDGYYIGDWLSFDSPGNYKISNDTIFKQDTAVAIGIEVGEQMGSDMKLILKSPHTGELGTYHQK